MNTDKQTPEKETKSDSKTKVPNVTTRSTLVGKKTRKELAAEFPIELKAVAPFVAKEKKKDYSK